MAIIGSLVKAGLAVSQKLNFRTKPPAESQLHELKKLLNTAKDTAFGKYYGFKEILKADDIEAAYKKAVPIFDYNRMHDHWWLQQQKVPDITWPGMPDFFALSSGTTGKTSKRIPITAEFIQSMREVGASLVKSLPNFDFPEELFEREIMVLSSTANLSRHELGYKEGEISGINVSNFPNWYDLFYRPGKEIASIDSWDERLRRIVEEAPNWDIGAICGIPSWVLMTLREIIKAHNLKSIHEIWPHLTVYASGGVAFETYRKGFEAICERPLTIIDTYLASEGFFAYTARPDTLNMQLATAHGYYYEFIPFDETGVDAQGNILENPVSYSISEVEEGKEYVLLVSTCSGAWRYMIGDTIKFTDLEAPEMKLSGRTKFFLNVVGSQLSEEKLDAAVVEVSKKFKMDINEYSVAAVRRDDDYIHQWILVSDDHGNEEQIKVYLDESLKSANKNYGVARSKALKGLAVKVISKNEYHEYLEKEKKKGGQVKIPKVMDEEKMLKYLEFLAVEPVKN